jgi:hypothetical protein
MAAAARAAAPSESAREGEQYQGVEVGESRANLAHASARPFLMVFIRKKRVKRDKGKKQISHLKGVGVRLEA